MDSSTFNSEPPTPPHTWAHRVLRAAQPTLLVTLLILGAAAAAVRRGVTRHLPVTNIEDVIIDGQLRRVATARGADVLIIGDSSALMDVDAVELGRLLGGKRVESLALIGYVGPLAQVTLAERAMSGDKSLPLLVWLVNGQSLDLDEHAISGQPYEALVLHGTRPPQQGLPRRVRDVLYAATLGRLVARPLPGKFGGAYGFADDLDRAIDLGHGTVTDPNRFTDAKPPAGGYSFRLSPPVEQRLGPAGEVLHRVPAARVALGITPLPRSWVGPRTDETRAQVLAALCAKLGLPAAAALATPTAFADDRFATSTHLAASGRADFTRELARILAAP